MTKRGKGKRAKTTFKAKGGGQGQTFTDHNLAEVSPNSQQFEPTADSPIRQRAKMGGVS